MRVMWRKEGNVKYVVALSGLRKMKKRSNYIKANLQRRRKNQSKTIEKTCLNLLFIVKNLQSVQMHPFLSIALHYLSIVCSLLLLPYGNINVFRREKT